MSTSPTLLRRKTRSRATLLVAGVVLVLVLLVANFIRQRSSAETLSLAEVGAKYAMPASRFIEVAGVRVHYVDQGTGPVLVLFHGSFGSLRAFDGFVAPLRDRYRIIRFDQAPGGLSGPVPPGFNLTPEAFTREFLGRLGVGKAALLGTSSGGIYAYRYAGTYPEDVTALILASVPPMAPVDNAGARNRLPWLMRQSMQACQKYAQPWSRTCWDDFLGHTIARPEHRPAARVAQYYDMNRRADSRTMNSMTAIMRDDALVRSFLARVRAPTLLIWGDRGNVLPPSTAATLAQRLTGTTVTTEFIERVAHYPPMDAPEEVAGLTDRFIVASLSIPTGP